MKITFISTYPPRKCGIATYTRDLVTELQQQKIQIEVVAMDTKSDGFVYPSIVKKKIEKFSQEAYTAIAQQINKSNTDIVHIQHEFGIFGGRDGEYILDFARSLTKPFVVTFHTILRTPSTHQLEIMKELTRLSRGVITMKEIGKDRLINIYGFNERDIHIIFHGVPTIDRNHKELSKKKLGFDNRFILMTSNLISRNKGIEYVIEALPHIVKSIPKVLFLVVGETHPEVKKIEGETYRQDLIQLVKVLNLQEHVRFINEYLPLQKLKEYFSATDIAITPYTDPEQITSGTLAYAVGAGKVCISTPYIYAKTMLQDKRGILVPFKDASAIAIAVVDVYTHPKKRIQLQKNAYILGKEMRWTKVAKNHVTIYKRLLRWELYLERAVIQFIKKPLDIAYLYTLTTPVGIMQHTLRRIPDNKHGYSTDDNARALIVVSELYKRKPSARLFGLIKEYLGFLYFAQEENGKFHIFLGPNNTWQDQEEIHDAFGKALWAVGYFLYVCPTSPFARSADRMFRRTLTHIPSIQSIRTAAFVIFGLFCYYKAFHDEKDSASTAYEYLIQLADFLIQKYNQERSDGWEWFESTITYDNFRMPQALFLAYLVTEKKEYKEVAEKTLEFIISANYTNTAGNHFFDFIGQNGWYTKGQEKTLFDQQPLEVSAAVSALVLAYRITKKKRYKQLAIEAFAWFFGKNRNHSVMIDDLTKGVYDGLTTTGVNENQGSESVICFLMAHVTMQEIVKRHIKKD